MPAHQKTFPKGIVFLHVGKLRLNSLEYTGMERQELSLAGREAGPETLPPEVLTNMDFPWTEIGEQRSNIPGLYSDICNEFYKGRVSFEGGTYDAYAMRSSPQAFIEPRDPSFVENLSHMMNIFILKFGDLETNYTLALQATYASSEDTDSLMLSRDLPLSRISFRISSLIYREGDRGLLRRIPKTSSVLFDGMLTYLREFTAKLPDSSFRHFVTNGEPRFYRKNAPPMPQEKWNELFVQTLERHGYQAIGKDKQRSDVWWRDYNVPTD